MTNYLFSGLKVLDVGTWIAGPVAATILADFGADVIKVEMPGVGDQYRTLSAMPIMPDASVNYCWEMDARNKRSLALNLKTPEGMDILHKLIRECDVYITNQPLPMRKALSLNYEDLKPLNPSMIYASLTAYGEVGPDKDAEAFDLVAYWARSGLMDLVRDAQARPAMALPGMGDHPAAMSLYASIVTALLHKERTGEGSKVHTSLLANGLWGASCVAQAGFSGGDYQQYRAFKSLPGLGRYLFKCSDGRYLQFTMVRSPEEFECLLKVLGLGLATDPRFATPEDRLHNGYLLAPLIEQRLTQKSANEWLTACREMAVPANAVSLVEDMPHDEQVLLNNMAVPPVDADVGSPLVINHPLNIEVVPQVGPKKPPELGEHTVEILEELGLDDENIHQLRQAHIV